MLTILTLLLVVVCGLGTGQIAYGQASPLVSVDYTPASLRLPDYFVEHRVQLHTRLSLRRWGSEPVFTEAERYFSEMGVKVYTRHCKTGDEGAWWPSSVGAIDPRTNGEDIAQQMIDRAHANDLRIIQYHRHMEDEYMAAQHPNWVCVDEDGTTLPASRGDYMCLNSPYLDYFTTRMLELTERGADGFYFDSKHMPADGCWCQYCRSRFTSQTGLTPPDSHDYSDRKYIRYLRFKNETIERGIGHYIDQAHGQVQGLPMLISVTYVPWLHDPRMRSGLVRIAPAPKSEFEMPIRRGVNRFFWKSGTSIPVPEPDVEMAFAFSYLRDAAQGRPGHLWANDLRSPEEALAASAACLTYGMIANLDIDEPTIPNPMFTAALQMGERVSRYLAHTRPVRWAAIHFSERGRDLYLTDQENMYRKVIVPCWQSFQALSRIGAPIGIVTDEQVAKNELDGYKVLVLAAPGVLTAEEQGNVDAFQANGGIVIELAEDSRWYTKGRQSAIRAEFLNNVLAQAGQPPVSMRDARDGVHAVAVKHPDDADRVVVCVTNEFTWLGKMQKHRLDGDYATEEPGVPPAPVTDAVVFIKGPEPEYVFDAASGKELTAKPVGDGAQISLPAFDYLTCVVVNYSKFGAEELAGLASHWPEENLIRGSERIVGWWKFDEGSGVAAADSSGRGHNGTLKDTDTASCWVNGTADGALDFDGSSERMEVPDSNKTCDFAFKGGVTWSAWVKTTSGSRGTIISKSPTDLSNSSGNKRLFMAPSGRIKLLVSGTSGAVASAGRINDGHWHHVAMTVEFETSDSNDTVKLYIDANEDGGSTNTRDINKKDDSDYIIMVGRIDALIDDVRIYNYVLDANEIGRLHEGLSPEDKLICSQCPDEDMNRDCKIDFLDFAVLANHWLGSTKQQFTNSSN